MKILNLKDNQDLRKFLGYLRNEYNSYELGTKKPHSDLLDIQYLPNRLKQNIKENVKLSTTKIITRKSGNINLQNFKGFTCTVKNGNIYVQTKMYNLTYKFDIESGDIKDGIYSTCFINVKNNYCTLVINELKVRGFKRYLDKKEFNRRKEKQFKKSYCNLIQSLNVKKPGAPKTFFLDIIKFMRDLDDKFELSNNKRIVKSNIPKLYNEYVDSINMCENQAQVNMKNLFVCIFKEFSEVMSENQRNNIIKLLTSIKITKNKK